MNEADRAHLSDRRTRPSRIAIGSVPVDQLTFADAIAAMVALIEARRGGTVFTPNIDHVVRAERDPAFREAYHRASLSIVDGMPLVWASWLMGTPLAEKISGSDWLEPLLAACAARGHTVYFLGGRLGAGARAKARMEAKYPGLRVVGVGPRTRDVATRPGLLDHVVADLAQHRPAVAVVALGSPLQEVWSDAVRDRVAPTVLVGLGSALDLAAGMINRAPPQLSQAGLEWLYRLAREPRRLWRRYLVGGPQFAWIVARQLARRCR